MTTAIAPHGLAPRQAKSSDDYVSEIISRRSSRGDRPMSKSAKQQKMAAILSDAHNGIRRLGVGMIGPIQLKLRYQGVVRNVLMEDPIEPGTPVEYDIFDDLGQAYIMSGTDGEVRITPFEGKRARIDFFRIASQPVVRKEDLYLMRVNVVEQAQDETKQAIMKQEDARLFLLLQAALTSYASRSDHVVTPNHVVTEVGGYFTPDTMYSTVALTDQHELEAARIVVSPADYRDFYKWDVNTTGWAFKDRVVAGEKITTFGEFQIARSIQVTAGEAWLLPEPNFLGVFPVLYSLDVEENHRVEAFQRGWVFDEMVNMTILNPRGIAKMVKA
jgi:hypothetical protein